MTRQDYMDGKVTHAQYYKSVAKLAGISFDNSDMLPEIVKALADGSENLNRIRLTTWDAKAIFARPAIEKALKAHGDFYSLAGGVCTLKAAARVSARKVMEAA